MRIIDQYKLNIVDRSKKFAVEIILFSSKLPKNPAGYTVSDQLVRAGTSIGANLTEAQESISKSEFKYKINISLKEAKETLYWLDLIRLSEFVSVKTVQPLLQECEELVKILVTISRKLNSK